MCLQTCSCVSVAWCWGKQQGIEAFFDTMNVMSSLYALFYGVSFLGEVIRGAQWNHEKLCGGGACHQ